MDTAITADMRAMAARAALVERGAMVGGKQLPLRYWAALDACRRAGVRV